MNDQLMKDLDEFICRIEKKLSMTPEAIERRKILACELQKNWDTCGEYFRNMSA